MDYAITIKDHESSNLDYTIHYTIHSGTKNIALIFAHPFNNSRDYWKPQLEDPKLAEFPKVIIDGIGFAKSRTNGRSWNFDLAASSILQILEKHDISGVLVGDSLGGGPTGLRLALSKSKRILGVVACGTSAEEESEDFVTEYTAAAEEFAKKCLDPSFGPTKAITEFSKNMAISGYYSEPESLQARLHGTKVIEASLLLSLSDSEGVLDPQFAGDTMRINYHALNSRPSLIDQLTVTPIECPILVIHGSLDKAYPLERGYHLRTVAAIGEDKAELLVVEGGSHFVTATNTEEVDSKIVEWIERRVEKVV